MTKIEDMSETEWQAWATLIVDVFVFIWFIQKMTFGTRIESHTPDGLVGIFFGVIITTIILHAMIAAIFALRKRQGEADVKDERDILIERQGAAFGFTFVTVIVNIIIGHYLIENTLEGYESVVSLQNPSHMFFALMSAMFIGDIIKNGVMVLAYRGD